MSVSWNYGSYGGNRKREMELFVRKSLERRESKLILKEVMNWAELAQDGV
jgi:hypothetical protein